MNSLSRETYALRAAFGDCPSLPRIIAKRVCNGMPVAEIAQQEDFSPAEVDLASERYAGAMLGVFFAELATERLSITKVTINPMSGAERDELVASLLAAKSWKSVPEQSPLAQQRQAQWREATQAWDQAMLALRRSGLYDTVGALVRYSGLPEEPLDESRTGISTDSKLLSRIVRYQRVAAMMTVLADNETQPKAKAVLTGLAAAAAFARTQAIRSQGQEARPAEEQVIRDTARGSVMMTLRFGLADSSTEGPVRGREEHDREVRRAITHFTRARAEASDDDRPNSALLSGKEYDFAQWKVRHSAELEEFFTASITASIHSLRNTFPSLPHESATIGALPLAAAAALEEEFEESEDSPTLS